MRLLQLVSPALPIGAFAYSQGLEQAVTAGWVTTRPRPRDWMLGLLEHSFGTLDLPGCPIAGGSRTLAWSPLWRSLTPRRA